MLGSVSGFQQIKPAREAARGVGSKLLRTDATQYLLPLCSQGHQAKRTVDLLVPSRRLGAIAICDPGIEGLARFLDHGRIELDSNVVEQAIRPMTLGRKNHPFAGSDRCAEHWPVLASLIETCKLNGVEPQAWLADVIGRIVQGHRQSEIDQLLPWNHAPESATLAA